MMTSAMLISIFISIVLLFYIHTSFKRNFIKVYHWPNGLAYLVDFIIIFSTSFRFVFRNFPDLLKFRFFYYVINLSYVLLGVVGLITLMIIIMDLEHLFHISTRRFYSNKNQKIEGRRAFLKKTITLGGLTGTGIVTGLGFANSFDPKVKKVFIPLKPQFQNLQGLKIVQLSDIHIGPTLQKEFSEKLVIIVNSLNPDLVVITGDLVDGEVNTTGADVLPLKNLKGKLGTYYITGNHEYYWNGLAWIEFVNSIGIKALVNENVLLKYNNQDFYLCGVPDVHASRPPLKQGPDFKKAKENIPDDKFKILLSHQPVTCYEAVKHGYHLMLSGHTHGGQGFPWNFIVRMVQPYIKGHYVHEGMNLYVNSGTGFWGPPNRFMVDSEITLIELDYKHDKIS